MLCYAWNRAEEVKNLDLRGTKGDNIYDLLSLVLCNSVSKLIKKGIYKQYISTNEETYSLKGKINFGESLKKNSFKNGRGFCEFDEFSDDIIHNQIIKATLYNILKCKTVDKNIKDKVMKLYHYFDGISSVKLNKTSFEKAKTHRNNRHYKFSLDICKLIYNDMIVDELTGNTSFNYKEEEKLAYLFEDFVRNFYKIHLSNSYVCRENIKWATVGNEMDLLPIMQTDITIKREHEIIIMDTKYYKNTLVSNMGQDKYHSTNMYQMFSYLKNAEAKGSLYKNSKGILLYPQVNKSLDNVYKLQDHVLKICTINLNNEWTQIHNRLLEIVGVENE